MKEFSVCYDRFCIGRFSLAFDDEEKVIPFDGLGAFEMYLLGMWNDGMVVTMKGYDEEAGENQFVLLLPDGSERLMVYSGKEGFVIQPFRKTGDGHFAYLLEFLKGLEYKGYRGYEEYDGEEGMICGIVTIGEENLAYCGKTMNDLKADFIKVIEKAIL